MKSFTSRTLFATLLTIMALITGCNKEDSTAWDDDTNSPASGFQENSSESLEVYPLETPPQEPAQQVEPTQPDRDPKVDSQQEPDTNMNTTPEPGNNLKENPPQ